jgi:hypothetical protein
MDIKKVDPLDLTGAIIGWYEAGFPQAVSKNCNEILLKSI